MDNTKSSIKIGLLGTTGVGKDTCVNFILDHFQNLSVSLIRLADPLYKAQESIYEICKTSKEFYSQDGELLNFLGSHMRKINPNVIKDAFSSALRNINLSFDFIICTDVRPVDVPFVRSEGFKIIHIETVPAIALERRKLRGDVSLGNSNHVTEIGLDTSVYDYLIDNNGSLADFQISVKNLITSLTENK